MGFFDKFRNKRTPGSEKPNRELRAFQNSYTVIMRCTNSLRETQIGKGIAFPNAKSVDYAAFFYALLESRGYTASGAEDAYIGALNKELADASVEQRQATKKRFLLRTDACRKVFQSMAPLDAIPVCVIALEKDYDTSGAALPPETATAPGIDLARLLAKNVLG